MKWETIIGLEIHVQLKTNSKLFSGSATHFGAPPNTEAPWIDLGFPGTLPVLNQQVLAHAVTFALAIGSQINSPSIFARKNYFYPDLPKGYQISQADHPVMIGGQLTAQLSPEQSIFVRVHHARLEEDAGKSMHDQSLDETKIDLNRAGTPLLEIVTEPDLRSASDAVAILKSLHELVCYLGISDGNMQEGSFRCDANVSVRPMGTNRLGTRTEIKNLNSFRFIEDAIEYEASRQIDVLTHGGSIQQQTRLYDPEHNETRAMRSKETAHDYRYFSDPDLLPVIIDHSFIDMIRTKLPELPEIRRARFIAQYGLTIIEARQMTADRAFADFFEALVLLCPGQTKLVVHWLTGEWLAALNKNGQTPATSPVTPMQMGALLKKISENVLSLKMAKQVFDVLWKTPFLSVDTIIAQLGLIQLNDETQLKKIIQNILDKHPNQVTAYRSGKQKLLGFFFGEVMKATKGQANPTIVNTLLQQYLKP